jgi:hypothetical protein
VTTDGPEQGGSDEAKTERSQHPDWFLNLMAHSDQASMELPGEPVRAVTPVRLTGRDRDEAWARIEEAAPRIAKYQGKSERVYPLVRLTASPA